MKSHPIGRQRHKFFSAEAENGDALIAVLVFMAAAAIGLVMMHHRLTQAAQLVESISDVRADVPLMSYIASRHRCIFQVYNEDLGSMTTPWTCTAGQAIKLYGLPGYQAWGTLYGSTLVDMPSTTLSAFGQRVRARCITAHLYAVEAKKMSPASAPWHKIGEIDCAPR